MGSRKEAQITTDPAQWRRALLVGISDREAVMLYDSGMAALEQRGQADYVNAMLLRDAALWTQDIAKLRRKISEAIRTDRETEDAALRAMMRNKAMAEKARREILDGLLLTPQRPRGRPRKDGGEMEGAEESADAWESFDDPAEGKTASDDGFARGGGL